MLLRSIIAFNPGNGRVGSNQNAFLPDPLNPSLPVEFNDGAPSPKPIHKPFRHPSPSGKADTARQLPRTAG